MIRNLTPHPMILLVEDATGDIPGIIGYGPTSREAKFRLLKTIDPVIPLVRVDQTDIKVGEVEVDGVAVELVRTTFGSPLNLPNPEAGIFLAVSIITAQAAQAVGRSTDDLLVPSEMVRHIAKEGPDKGRIIGCTRFAIR